MSVTKFDPKTDSLPGPTALATKPEAAAGALVAASPSAGEAANDPANIQVTPVALAHMREQIRKSAQSHIRLGVKESGCNGYMYTLDFVDGAQADDLIVQVAVEDDEEVGKQDGPDGDTPALELIVATADLGLVNHTNIDLVTEGLNSSLVFKNPNAESHCGCGESFSVAAVTPDTSNNV